MKARQEIEIEAMAAIEIDQDKKRGSDECEAMTWAEAD
jgi:hypothetical protein